MNLDLKIPMIDKKELSLRKLKISDITKDYIRGLNTEDIMKFTESREKRWTINSVKKYIKEQKKNSILLGIFYKKKHIGSIRLHSISKKNKRCELGILIFDRNYWNLGIGTEALNLALIYVFTNLKLNKVVANYFKNNISSQKIFNSAGFKIEGLLREQFLTNSGKFHDGMLVSILRSEFHKK